MKDRIHESDMTKSNELVKNRIKKTLKRHWRSEESHNSNARRIASILNEKHSINVCYLRWVQDFWISELDKM